MNLHARLFLGYGYLAALLLLVAIGSALAFHRLGSGIGRILDENVESVRLAAMMLEALERQDSAGLEILLGNEEAEALLQDSERAFHDALERAEANITLEPERAILRDIREGFQAYGEARDRLLASRPERPLAAYQSETLPRFGEVKALLFNLLDVNHRAIVEADQRTQGTATGAAAALGLISVLVILSVGFLSRSLQTGVLARLDELRTVALAVAGGDRHRRVRVDREDELGLVGRQFNEALDMGEAARAEMQGRFAELSQLLLALLAASPRPSTIFDLRGQILATGHHEDELPALENLAEAIRAGRPPSPKGGSPGATPPTLVIQDPNGAEVALRLLSTPDGRPAGWLLEGPLPSGTAG